MKLAHHVTTKESTANYEIITLELPEDSDGARAVDDGMKHVSSDAHQEEVASDTTEETVTLNMKDL